MYLDQYDLFDISIVKFENIYIWTSFAYNNRHWPMHKCTHESKVIINCCDENKKRVIGIF